MSPQFNFTSNQGIENTGIYKTDTPRRTHQKADISIRRTVNLGMESFPGQTLNPIQDGERYQFFPCNFYIGIGP